ncbi:MAG: nitroreductase family protein [Bacteroidales bacterium]|nr:nitroreductase family protein [Bacteroidales bacterium]
MSFLDLAIRRFSARGYLKKEIPDKELHYVLEAGRVAPSAANYQPWLFYVVRNEGAAPGWKEVYARGWFFEAPVFIVICGDHSASWKRGDGKDHCDIDLAIAADHMTLAAADAGLGTCWICNFNKNKVVSLLELPEHIEPAIILSLGYPSQTADMERHSVKRKSFNEVVVFK